MHFASYYRWIVIKKYLKLPSVFDGTVLDIGADDGGFLTKVLAPMKVGTDLIARPQVAYEWLGADACHLPFADGMFDTVFAFDVIEHIVADGQMFAEATRVLKPDGTLWLSTTAEKFQIFPGGFVQRQFEKGIGHVRQGYSRQMIDALVPDDARLQIDIFWWHEPFFRAFYLPLFALKNVNYRAPNLFIPLLVKLDALFREGDGGHLFAKFSKR